MTDTDIWNWISAFIQSFAETFLLVNVYCAFLGQPRIKKYVAYSLISCFAIAYIGFYYFDLLSIWRSVCSTFSQMDNNTRASCSEHPATTKARRSFSGE